MLIPVGDLQEYWGELYPTLSVDYTLPHSLIIDEFKAGEDGIGPDERIAADCDEIARLITGSLILQGLPVKIRVITDPDRRNAVKVKEPPNPDFGILIPRIFDSVGVRWHEHYIAATPELVYDPVFPWPYTYDEYLSQMFDRAVIIS